MKPFPLILWMQFTLALFCLTYQPDLLALDVKSYTQVAKKSFRTTRRGRIRNVERLIDQQRQLIRLAIEGALEYAENHPGDAKMLHLTILNTVRMQNLPEEQFTRQWLNGGYLRSHGINLDQYQPTDPPRILYQALVTPAHVIVLLKQYKTSRSAALIGTINQKISALLKAVAAL